MHALIDEIVKSEFGSIADRFETLLFSAGEKPSDKNVHRPGVYIFYLEGKVWKIGKSNTDAYVRCLQHFRDDTGSNKGFGLKQYENDYNMQIMLYLLKVTEDIHWLYALECFLESHYRKNGLVIPSARL